MMLPMSHKFDNTKEILTFGSSSEYNEDGNDTICLQEGDDEDYTSSQLYLHDIRRQKAFQRVLIALGREKIPDSFISQSMQTSGTMPLATVEGRKQEAHSSLSQNGLDIELQLKEQYKHLKRYNFEPQYDESSVLKPVSAPAEVVPEESSSTSTPIFSPSSSIEYDYAHEDEEWEFITSQSVCNPNTDILLLDSHFSFLDAILDEIEAENRTITRRESYHHSYHHIAQDVADENVIPWILPFINSSNLIAEHDNSDDDATTENEAQKTS